MIFNISSGGVAFINVTAPSRASISASCSDITVTGTGTCILEVPLIGTWAISCTYSGITKTSSVVVASYGSSHSVTFTYAVPLTVSTFPNAGVIVSMSGQDDLEGTADSEGSVTFNLTVLGAWTVTASNGNVTESGTVTASTFNDTLSISLLRGVPSITVVADGHTYNYTGAGIDNEDLYISAYSSGWKFYMKKTGTVKFNFLTTAVDICAIGNGGNGGTRFIAGDSHYGGGGGSGGEMITKTSQSLAVGTKYNVTVGSSVEFGSIASPRNGNNAAQSTPGAAVGTSPAGGVGAFWEDRTSQYNPPDDGGNGLYAFGDSSFDGVQYCNGGGGGYTNYSGGGAIGQVYSSYGSGGAGGGEAQNTPTQGIQGVVILRNAS